jgi:hypothetical protein
LAQVSILSLELLKIHVIHGLACEVTVVTYKAEALPTASAMSTVPGPGVGEESKKTNLEAVVAARIMHLEAGAATIL